MSQIGSNLNAFHKGDAAEDLRDASTHVVGDDVPVATADDTSVRRFPAAIACALVDET